MAERRSPRSASTTTPPSSTSRIAAITVLGLGLTAAGWAAFTHRASAPAGEASARVDSATEGARSLRSRHARHAARVLDHGRDLQAMREAFVASMTASAPEATHESRVPPAMAIAEERALHPQGNAAPAEASVRFPREGSGAFEFELGGRRIAAIREAGLVGAGETVDQSVSYARRDGRVYWSADSHQAEEWLDLHAGVARAGQVVARWTVEGVTPRQVDDRVVLDDARGVPVLVAAAPMAVTASGREVQPRLGIDGNAITLEVDAGGEAVLVDPSWTLAGAMNVARSDHTSTVLQNGKVLVTGGYSASAETNTAELYDPATNTWTLTGSMSAPRYLHAAALLSDGRVLVAGGWNGTTTLKTAEIYDPSTGTFKATGAMAAARYSHTATTLGNGSVLIAGGADDSGNGLISAERFNPGVNSFSSMGNMTTARYLHAATRFGNNRVLISGGFGSTTGTATTEIFDPGTSAFTPSASMSTIRYYHTSTLLSGSRALIVGGKYSGNPGLATAEIFTYSTLAFTNTAGAMTGARYYHTATLLSSGNVAIAGGYNGSTTLGTSELYSNLTGTFSAGPAMSEAVGEHHDAALANGKVLVSGGYSGTTAHRTTTSQLLAFNDLGQACTTNADCGSGFCSDGVCCDSNCGTSTTDCRACSVAAGASADGTCTTLSAGTVCRALNGVCDAVETCDGTSTACPADVFASSTTVCRAINGVCDVAEYCTGTSRSCPTNVYAPTTQLCRAQNGACDVAEYCNGTMKSCPADAYAKSTQVCRAATGVCDLTESCTGTSKTCPTDQFVVAYTACDGSGNVCNGSGMCVTPYSDGGLPKERLVSLDPGSLTPLLDVDGGSDASVDSTGSGSTSTRTSSDFRCSAGGAPIGGSKFSVVMLVLAVAIVVRRRVGVLAPTRNPRA